VAKPALCPVALSCLLASTMSCSPPRQGQAVPPAEAVLMAFDISMYGLIPKDKYMWYLTQLKKCLDGYLAQDRKSDVRLVVVGIAGRSGGEYGILFDGNLTAGETYTRPSDAKRHPRIGLVAKELSNVLGKLQSPLRRPVNGSKILKAIETGLFRATADAYRSTVVHVFSDMVEQSDLADFSVLRHRRAREIVPSLFKKEEMLVRSPQKVEVYTYGPGFSFGKDARMRSVDPNEELYLAWEMIAKRLGWSLNRVTWDWRL